MEESKFFSCLNFRTWGEVSEMVTGISEVNEGGEMGGELVEIWRKWFTMICFGWHYLTYSMYR